MKKVVICLLPILFMGIGCTQNIEEETEYGDIIGVVYDKSVGDPIAVAQVVLTPGGNSTVTGSDGTFAFKSIETGKYTVTVNKKGYNDGTNTVNVLNGTMTECNLLMERIPAYVTADKGELDFGDNVSLNTLSFNIVNSSYENLSWHIEYDKSSTSFITEVSPNEGTTLYGKTAVIVVKIDRERLNAGENKSTLVVVSDNGDGSSEVTIKAIGKEKTKPSLNLIGITDITSNSAVIQGEITFAGTPEYSERGFVYATTPNPTLDNEKVTATKTDEPEFSTTIKNLSLDVKYYVRAYAINEIGVAYSNQEDFFTVSTPPSVSMYSVDNINASSKTASLHGAVEKKGDPEYSERGFVYSEGRKTPTIEDFYKIVPGVGIETFDATISELKLGATYSVRAYAKNDGGIAYSERTVNFTLSGTLPLVSIKETSDIDLDNLTAVLHGSLDAVGSPAATEKGFVYSTDNHTPTSSDLLVTVKNAEDGAYYATISQLVLGKTYYVRAYAKNDVGIVYSENTSTFSTAPSLPSVSMRAVAKVDRDNLSALFQGSINSPGSPSFNEKGFVYSSYNKAPTTNDIVIKIPGSELGSYEATAAGLVLNNTYHVRAYASNAAGTIYSDDVVSFDLSGTEPRVVVSEASNVDLSNLTAMLNGYVTEIGFPVISERGFVYSYDNSSPTINDSKATDNGIATGGSYSIQIGNLILDKTYHIKAYVRNAGGLYYSDNTITFSTETTLPTLSIFQASDIDSKNHTASVSGSVNTAGNPPYTEKGFVYSCDVSIPTIENGTLITVAGTAIGSYSTTLTNLLLDKVYYIRSFAKNVKGTAYSEVSTFSLSGTDPIVSVLAPNKIDLTTLTAELHAFVNEIGNPAITERGFVYSSSKTSPTINDIRVVAEGVSSGEYSLTIGNLTLDNKYYVRAYVANSVGIYYSDKTVELLTTTSLPTLSINSVSDINTITRTATVSGSILTAGNPPFIEKGFVYSFDISAPTIENSYYISVDGASTGLFSATLSNLVLEKRYHVRTFAKNAKGTTYSQPAEFNTFETLPSVSTKAATNVNASNKTAILNGYINDVGKPAYTEKGFVISTVNEEPTLNDTKIIVSGSESGAYSYQLTELSITKKTYYRAYAINNKGVAYGYSEVALDPEYLDMTDHIVLTSNHIAVQKEDIGSGSFEDLSSLCNKSTKGSYSDWRIPTKDELTLLYDRRSKIGFPKYGSGIYSYYYKYWSSTSFEKDGVLLYWLRDFDTGIEESQEPTTTGTRLRARCVRTMNE